MSIDNQLKNNGKKLKNMQEEKMLNNNNNKNNNIRNKYKTNINQDLLILLENMINLIKIKMINKDKKEKLIKRIITKRYDD
jgi:hypothetical protein